MDIGSIQPREITEELKDSYLDYAMSVIVARALPDVRDGMKPVQRRILFAMHGLGLGPQAKLRKSATVVGEVLGKYHPHGDSPVYDAMVRLAQDFSMRYPLVLGQGNFGCFTGDTKVQLVDGRALSFVELIAESKQGKRHYTYTYNQHTRRIEIAAIRLPRRTKRDAKLARIFLDNGAQISCTLDHRFLMRNGSYRQAKDLEAGDALMALYTRLSTNLDDPYAVGYEMVYQPVLQAWGHTHRLADEWNVSQNIYSRADGKVRHHIDFNKRNNNPENIRRLPWGEHWRIHADSAALRHRTDAEYRQRIAHGRESYYARADTKAKCARRIREYNERMWQDPVYRARKLASIRQLWADPKYRLSMAQQASSRLKAKWREAWFREAVGHKKSTELKARWRDAAYRSFWSEKMRELSTQIWAIPGHRSRISAMMKALWEDDAYRRRRSAEAKVRWLDPAYKQKFSKEHFRKAARKLWGDPATRELHREKAVRQWRNEQFRENVIAAVKRSNSARLNRNPAFMARLAAKAGIVLRRRWQDSSYKALVLRSRIAGYVAQLVAGGGLVTPERYEAERAGGVPRLERALQYFSSFEEIVERARRYNHKVVSVEFLREREDVYDLTIDGTHNFALAAGIFVHNSIDGDSQAAMRYTEAKLTPLAAEMLADIDRDTVDFVDNYDGTRQEPTVLPAKVPQLLLNGTVGIAVGMATNIPPHNLGEVVDALTYLTHHRSASVEELLKFVKGPDFPTGGAIYSVKDIAAAYGTGRGAIITRGLAEIVEGKGNTQQIIINSIPFQVNKATLIEHLAELVQEKKIEGIRDIRDESDKDGLRVAIDLKADAFPQKVLNSLYKYTDLQKTFHLNMLALVDIVQPQVLSLKGMLEEYLKHREVIVRRRAEFDLARARERAHILEGLVKALDQIDAVIKTIRQSRDRESAHQALKSKFGFTDLQASAILDMRLQTLAGLEQEKVREELSAKRKLMGELTLLLGDPKRILDVIRDELAQVKAKYGDERKTKVVAHAPGEIKEEDLVPEGESLVILTRGGSVKRMNPAAYRTQKRGGKGVVGVVPKEEDVVMHAVSAHTHSNLLFFTNTGKVFQTKTYEIPEVSRQSRGKAIENFLALGPGEAVTAILPYRLRKNEPIGAKFFVMGTASGIIKKTAIEEFLQVRRSGLIAIKLGRGDTLRWVRASGGGDEVMLVTKNGQAIRFSERDVRAMGRPAAGVTGIRLRSTDEVVGMEVIAKKAEAPMGEAVLVVTENGYGKRTYLKEYKKQKRAGVGVKTAKVTKKTGALVVAAVPAPEAGEVIALSAKGQVIRTPVEKISILGRATQGVRLMKVEAGDRVAAATVF